MNGFKLCLFVGLLFALTKPVGLQSGPGLDRRAKPGRIRSCAPSKNSFTGSAGLARRKSNPAELRRLPAHLQLYRDALQLCRPAASACAAPQPQGFAPVSPSLAFNTAASFTTNTDWQNYAGESQPPRTSPRWRPWLSTILRPHRRDRRCGRSGQGDLPTVDQDHLGISGSTRSRPISTFFFRFASSIRSSSYPRESSRISSSTLWPSSRNPLGCQGRGKNNAAGTELKDFRGQPDHDSEKG